MTNLEIAQKAQMLPIEAVAECAGLSSLDWEPLGRHKGKLTYSAMQRLPERSPQGKLILVTAINPTPAGEGKTTVTVGLSQGLRHIGKRSISATREPALGPVFGVKGGACGGGYSQVLPMEDINLFFTGDFPAIASAHSLLSALLDAHVHNGNELGIDLRRPIWPRTADMNDRALREVVVALGGHSNGFPRQDGFVITPASEVMAALCLSGSIGDLKDRMGRFIAAFDAKGGPVQASRLQAQGAMAALLRDAIRPNLVQTIEGVPALIHGGPFGNIAHGCSSLIATQCALGMADYTVTEAGFGSDLGAEKFMHIKCPRLGRYPDAIVLVATVRALKHHGGGDDREALRTGIANLDGHVSHLKHYGLPVLVAVNRFADDTQEEVELILDRCAASGVLAVPSDPWGGGGLGCVDLAHAVVDVAEKPSTFTPLYSAEQSFEKKVTSIVNKAYGGAGYVLSDPAKRQLSWIAKHGFDKLPVCMAKTQYSFSDNSKRLNRPKDFVVSIRDLKVSAGAGFLVAIAGDIMLMPGLGKEPAAHKIDVEDDGRIAGLF